ncbi:MAG: hypothetical protein IAB19_05700 [Proteobacteria bacterium]|uniref:Uncharacterized protein n=1 Tax=Candidatus Avisuccinivibrio stercorigallinarum TaxID=2840704 RepID=A0A9D9GTD5_9GAMM|nr:hypothetical protein [Candidatus Avisuccinivibrio stercorigallinarum]
MSKFFDGNLPQVPIPAQAKINHYGREVCMCCKSGSGRIRLMIIGQAVSDSSMLPNQNFWRFFPDKWAQLQGVPYIPLPERVLAGPYAITLYTAEKYNFYPILLHTLAPEKAHALLDLAVYLVSLNQRRGAAQLDETGSLDLMDVEDEAYADAKADAGDFPPEGAAAGQAWGDDSALMLFSPKISKERSSLSLADFAGSGSLLPAADELEQFKDVFFWSQMNSSSQSAYMCLSGPVSCRDGLYFVCTAIDAESLYPLFWKELQLQSFEAPVLLELVERAVDELQQHEINCECVIFDGCELSLSLPELKELFENLHEYVRAYVLRLPEDVPGFGRMIDKHGDDLTDLVHLQRRSRRVMCGLLDKRLRLFGSSKTEKPHPAAFFYDPLTAAGDNLKLVHAVMTEIERLNYAAASNAEQAVAPELKRFISKVTDKQGRVKYVKNDDLLQQAVQRTGFSLYVLSDLELGLEDVQLIFESLDNFRAQFELLKAEFDKAAPENLPACFAAALLAAQVRFEAEPSYSSFSSSFDPWQALERVCLRLGADCRYHPVYGWSEKLADFMDGFKVSEADLDQLAHELNLCAAGEQLPQAQRALPEITASAAPDISELKAAFELSAQYQKDKADWEAYFATGKADENVDWTFEDFETDREEGDPDDDTVQTSLYFALQPELAPKPAAKPQPEPETEAELKSEEGSEAAAQKLQAAESGEELKAQTDTEAEEAEPDLKLQSVSAPQPEVQSTDAKSTPAETEAAAADLLAQAETPAQALDAQSTQDTAQAGPAEQSEPPAEDDSQFFLMPQYEHAAEPKSSGRKNRVPAKKPKAAEAAEPSAPEAEDSAAGVAAAAPLPAAGEGAGAGEGSVAGEGAAAGEDFEEEFQLLPQSEADLSRVRRRGRPKGSMNKKTKATAFDPSFDLDPAAQPPKRGRGRPKGSRNKQPTP